MICICALQWTGQHAGIVTCCRFSHDGKLVISGSDLDNTLKIWDANSGELLQNLQGWNDNLIIYVDLT